MIELETLSQLCKDAYKAAKDKGWWEEALAARLARRWPTTPNGSIDMEVKSTNE